VLPPDDAWPRPNGPVSLAPGDVHVWRVSLAISALEEADRYSSLADDERARADRFLVASARTQFIAARSALRAILAGYVGAEARAIGFQLGPIGKPGLADRGLEPLFFNLSHSRELALVAVTPCGEIGVDVELVRAMASREQLAERFFHPNEVAALSQLPIDQRATGFFNAWTRKEAFLKATGKGISFGVERVEVTLAPGGSVRVLTVDGSQEAAAAWSLATLEPAPGYVGAIAHEGQWNRIVQLTH
jgi:4'-phosphopantetheinyl transferase